MWSPLTSFVSKGPAPSRAFAFNAQRAGTVYAPPMRKGAVSVTSAHWFSA